MKNMARFKNSPLLLWALPLTLFLSGEAFATNRTVYFVATGVNRTQTGLSSTAQSYCRITVSNPSTVQESVTLSTSAGSIDGWTGSAAFNPATVSSTAGSGVGTCTVSSCAITLSAGSSATINYAFTVFPAKPTGSNQVQALRCSGSVLVSDTGGSPGFVIANGILVTFTESSQMHTDSTTGGTATFGGTAVYSQIPIVINRAKPF